MISTALIMGASGETGKELLKELAKSSKVSKIISIGRRKLDVPDEEGFEKVEQKIVDFDNLDENAANFQNVDAAFCCLGTTRAKAGKTGFVKVDHDYVVKSAELLKTGGCEEFHLLTSRGSNPNSWLLYTQTKGQTEEDVKKINFNRLGIYRPGLLLCERQESRFGEKLLRIFANSFNTSYSWSVPTSLVARAMLLTSLEQSDGVKILEHADIVQKANIQ